MGHLGGSLKGLEGSLRGLWGVLGRSWEILLDLGANRLKKIALAISDYRPGEAKSVIRITFLRVPAEQERGSLQLLLNHVATILGPSWAVLGPS